MADLVRMKEMSVADLVRARGNTTDPVSIKG